VKLSSNIFGAARLAMKRIQKEETDAATL